MLFFFQIVSIPPSLSRRSPFHQHSIPVLLLVFFNHSYSCSERPGSGNTSALRSTLLGKEGAAAGGAVSVFPGQLQLIPAKSTRRWNVLLTCTVPHALNTPGQFMRVVTSRLTMISIMAAAALVADWKQGLFYCFYYCFLSQMKYIAEFQTGTTV